MSTNWKKIESFGNRNHFSYPLPHSFIWTFGLCEYSLIIASTWVILLLIFYLGEAAACGWDSLSPQWLAHVCVAEWSSSERCPDPAAASAETLVPEQRMTNDIKITSVVVLCHSDREKTFYFCQNYPFMNTLSSTDIRGKRSWECGCWLHGFVPSSLGAN